MESERQKVVEVARSWIGTPYHDNCGIKGVGVDCAYLLALVFEEAGVMPHIEIEDYSPQWFLHRDEERYMGYVLKQTHEISPKEAGPGDIVLYKLGRCYAHGAILTDTTVGRIVHAHKLTGCVTESGLFEADLRRRAIKIFSRW